MPKNLVVRPTPQPAEGSLVNCVSADQAGWQHLNMAYRRLHKNESWQWDTGENELVVVLLGGKCSVQSNQGNFSEVGGRQNVFDGMPHALYFSRRTNLTLTASTDVLEIACCWVQSTEDHPAQLITPERSKVELRGGGTASRQINSIVPPGFDCQKIVCVEVFTPAGNWSSYPPHKHDEHVEEDGLVLEADLEEIYFYKFRRPEGFAFQRIYTDDRSLDEAVVAQNNDIVLIPEGYHPVSTAYGYDCYYLNFLAGSAQSLAATDDPAHAWVKSAWSDLDNRLPMVSLKKKEALV